ncbi:hypothetical protein ACM01_04000 [Streptomyces viridochromogenes]|uniref:Bacterial mobilisation domain-containing protein n=1 Tax=Streptomyces viridochromogenes TaxID=1938 RepID=A0A0J8CGC9_STRVR|nr:hypothetical protein ACM01_04000 [Streptomyces viridochromogenes]
MIASRFNDAEKQSVLDAAAACAMTPSGFLAHAALSAARDLTRTEAEVAGEREMMRELFALGPALSRIGNNLNQVAAALNRDEPAPQARAVLDGVDQVRLDVYAFIQRYQDGGRPAA